MSNNRRRSAFGFFLALIMLVVAGAADLAAQWRQAAALRSKLELARMDGSELERLQVENQLLRGKQISDVQMVALRADHAAVARLRAELEALEHPQAKPGP